MVEGIKDGLKLAGRALIKGEPSDEATKIEHQKYKAITAQNVQNLPLMKKLAPNMLQEGGMLARGVDTLGEVIRTPGRFLMAEDEYFKTVGYRMELNAQAYRMARDEGLKGEEFARRVAEIKADPEINAPSVHMASQDASRYSTFTNALESKLGKALSSTQSAPLRLIIPFVRTPANILKFAFSRTPLAPFMKSVREDLAAGGARREMALARMSLGSMAMAYVATKAADGTITGGGPSDKGLRSHKYNTGWQPYSVKIGDTYYAYGRLEPLGMMMGLAADYVEVAGELGEVERDKIASMIVGSIGRNVMSKTWLRGLSETVMALDDPDRYGDRYVKRFVSTVVPTGVAQVERIVSPEMEVTSTYLDAIKSRVPGYSKDLPVRRNLWGDPIVLEGGLGPDIISPIYTSKETRSPVDEEILKLRMPVKMPQKTQTFEGVPIRLDPQEYDKLITTMNKIALPATGKNLKKSLEELIKSPEYKKLPNDTSKHDRMAAYFRMALTGARRQMLAESRKIRHDVDAYHQAVR